MRFYKKNKSRAKKVKVSAKPKMKISRSFAKKVKSVVQKVAEKKVAYFESDAQDMQNFSNTTSNNNTIVLTPYSGSGISIAQGTTQATRVGNIVNVTKATLDLIMRPLPYDATHNSVPMPQVILCYLWRLKNIDRDIVGAASVALSNFFQQGASSVGITGTLDDYLKKINTDQVTLYKKFYLKLGASVYSSNTGNQANQFNLANNDFKLCILKSIDISKYIKKLDFSDSSTTQVAGGPLYFTCSPCDADGGANASTTAAVPCFWSYRINYEFTDI